MTSRRESLLQSLHGHPRDNMSNQIHFSLLSTLEYIPCISGIRLTCFPLSGRSAYSGGIPDGLAAARERFSGIGNMTLIFKTGSGNLFNASSDFCDRTLSPLSPSPVPCTRKRLLSATNSRALDTLRFFYHANIAICPVPARKPLSEASFSALRGRRFIRGYFTMSASLTAWKTMLAALDSYKMPTVFLSIIDRQE